jgi:hypothetical protein
MGRFPVHFCGLIRTTLHVNDILGGKSITNFLFHCEVYCSSEAAEVMKKVL